MKEILSDYPDGDEAQHQCVTLANGESGSLGELVMETFMQDVREFESDQLGHLATNRWHDSTLRLCLATYARSPAAFEKFREHWLLCMPATSTLAKACKRLHQDPGLDSVLMAAFRQLYDARNDIIRKEGRRPPLTQELELAFDEVKLSCGIAFSSMGGKLRGVATTARQEPHLHDFFRTMSAEDDTPIASYALCFAVRPMDYPQMSSIIAFVLAAGNLASEFTLSTLLAAITLVQSFDFIVNTVIADGSSINVRCFKDLIGRSNYHGGAAHTLRSFSPSNPHFIRDPLPLLCWEAWAQVRLACRGRGLTPMRLSHGSSTLTSLTARFFLRSVVSCKDLCMLLHKVPLLIPPSLTASIADHCLKRAVRCLYDSHANRHKALLRPKTGGGRGVAFGWMPIEALYYENCTSLSPQVTFKRGDVFRDTWRCVSMLMVHGMISSLIVCKNIGV